MDTRSYFRKFFVVALLLIMCSKEVWAADCYPNPPNVLVCNAEMAAKDIVRNNDATIIQGRLATLMFYTIADALVGLANAGPLCELEDYQHLGETARTDKQIGASAKAEGSTSLVEKPGFAQLLGFAIEHGGIKQAVDGTTLTLSTSPYALIAMANRDDTAALYQQYDFFNRFGLSASFNISDKDNLLGSVSKKQLSEWSVRARLTADRTSRGEAFRAFWTSKIAPAVDARLRVTSVENKLINDDPFAGPIYRDYIRPGTSKSMSDAVDAYLRAHASDSDDQKISGIKELIFCDLKRDLYDPIKAKPDVLFPPEQRAKIGQILAMLPDAQQRIKTARAEIEAYIKELDNKPMGTFEYTNHRDAENPDYSELKLLYRASMKPMKVIANAGISLYHNPNKMMNQETVRDFSFALSLEGEASNPFSRIEDLSKITYSFNGSYERVKENETMMMRKPDIASFQFKMEFPIAIGLSIPVSYTYSSATEMGMKKENRFNIGLHLDVDKLFALRQTAAH